MEPGTLTHRSKTVVEASRLHRARDRHHRGLTLVEGPHVLSDLTRAGVDIVSVFFAENDPGFDRVQGADLNAFRVDDRALQRLTGTRTPRGPVAVVSIPAESDIRGLNLLVSWGVSDPGNVGTMIRTAAAFGWAFGYLPGSADPWSPKTLRAGVGVQLIVPVTSVAGVDDLRRRGLSPWATVVSGGVPPEDLPRDGVAVLIGEEAAGLPEEIVAQCDGSVTIPMPGGVESLNAAVAAGIIVHAHSRYSGSAGEGV